MMLYQIFSIVWLILYVLLFIIVFILNKRRELHKNFYIQKFLNIMFFLILIMPYKFLSNIYLILFLVLMMITPIFILILFCFYYDNSLQYIYLFFVISSVTFAYFSPYFINLIITLAKKLNSSQYAEEMYNSYKKILSKTNFKKITYSILFVIYLYKNFCINFGDCLSADFNLKIITNVLTESLLTFVMIDSIFDTSKKIN